MPRKNSTAWAPGNPVLATRLEAINTDIDDLYATGSDHLKVYRLAADPALQVTIGSGTYRVWGTEGQYAWWILTVGASVTTYIMITSAGAIATSTSAWNANHVRLAVVVSGASTITSITDWRNKVVGGDFGGNPTGAVLMWSTNTAPAGYLLCDGTAVSRTTYAALFALVSTTYGVGDGSTTFNLPNLKWSVPVGLDTGQAEFDVMGETGGAKTHTLGLTETPAHTHTTSHTAVNAAAWGYQASAGTIWWNSFTNTSSSQGGWLSHNNLQPYLVLTFIIKT